MRRYAARERADASERRRAQAARRKVRRDQDAIARRTMSRGKRSSPWGRRCSWTWWGRVRSAARQAASGLGFRLGAASAWGSWGSSCSAPCTGLLQGGLLVLADTLLPACASRNDDGDGYWRWMASG